MENVTDELFSEIQEELRQEKVLEFWKKYHRPILTAMGLIVLGIVGYSSWSQHAQKKAQEAASGFVEVARALADKDQERVRDLLRHLEKTAPRKAAYLAAIMRCALVLENRAETPEARDAVKNQLFQISQNKKIERIWRDLALLVALSYEPKLAEVSEVQLKALTAFDAPYRVAAQELSALYALERGDKKEARAIFEQILEEAGAPSSVKERAMLMLHGPSLRS